MEIIETQIVLQKSRLVCDNVIGDKSSTFIVTVWLLMNVNLSFMS